VAGLLTGVGESAALPPRDELVNPGGSHAAAHWAMDSITGARERPLIVSV